MKNILSFLLYCLSITAILAQGKGETTIEIAAQNREEVVLELTLDGFSRQSVTTPRGLAEVLTFQDGTPHLEKGAPDLQKYAVSLAIPLTGAMQVELVEGDFYEVDNVEVAPSKGNFKRNIKPSDVPYLFGAAYEKNAFYPGITAALQEPFVMRSVRGQGLWIYPLQYNPVSKKLRVYQTMKIRVFRTDSKGKNELLKLPKSHSRTFEQLYHQTFLNYDPALYGAANRGNFEGEKMLIISPIKYESQLAPWIEWRNQMGIKTYFSTTEEIGATNAPVLAHIRQFYEDEGITYLLLVGNEEDIDPVFRESGGINYACENCFGYMEGDDHVGETLVGRFVVSDASGLQTALTRNMAYEKMLHQDTTRNWLQNGVALASSEGDGIGDDNQSDWQQGNEWKSKHLADGYSNIWEFYENDQSANSPTLGHFTADKPGDPVNTDIIQMLNQFGASIFNYTGHGWEQGLSSGNFSVQAVNANLQNAHEWPIVVGVACCAGDYTDNNGGDCLGEAMQRLGNTTTGTPFGAIAGFFSSDYQSWAPPMEGQDQINQFLIDADGVALTPHIGALMVASSVGMIASYGPDGESMADFWIPFFEPATVARTRNPLPLAASGPDSLFIGQNQITIACATEGTLVGLHFHGACIGAGWVENGVAVINIDPLVNIGGLLVTCTQFNHVPYQFTIPVAPKAGPFVTNQSFLVDDATLANGNNQIEYSEEILLNLTLSNLGLDSAKNVQATVFTTDAYLSLSDFSENFGDMHVSESKTIAGAFRLLVADSIPNNYRSNLSLTIRYNDSITYQTVLPLRLYAPVLAVNTVSVDDSGSSKANSRLDAGETASIRIKTKNNGNATSPTALGSLSSSSPYVTISTATSSLGSLGIGTETEAGFEVTVSPDAPFGSTAEFTYSVGAGPYKSEKTFVLMLNAIIENFETNNFSSFPWQFTSGIVPWRTVAAGAYDGQYCSRSGTIGHDRKTQMFLDLNVVENGSISFFRRVSSEEAWDFLRFYIDSTVVGEWSGEIPWGEVTFPITVGQHRLLWSYEKDEFASGGEDRAWVDNVNLPPFNNSTSSAIENADMAHLNVYPNPTSQFLSVDFDFSEGQNLDIQLFDLHGKLIWQVAQQKYFPQGFNHQVMDINGLPSGLYFLVLKGKTGVFVRKVVKE